MASLSVAKVLCPAPAVAAPLDCKLGERLEAMLLDRSPESLRADLAAKIEALSGARRVDEITTVLDAIRAAEPLIGSDATGLAFREAARKLQALPLDALPEVLARIPPDMGADGIVASAMARAYSGPVQALSESIDALPRSVVAQRLVGDVLTTLCALHPSETVRSAALRRIDPNVRERLVEGPGANFASLLAPVARARSVLKDSAPVDRLIDYLSKRLAGPHQKGRESAIDALARIAKGEGPPGSFALADRVRAVRALKAALDSPSAETAFGKCVELMDPSLPSEIKDALRSVLPPEDFGFAEALSHFRSSGKELRKAALHILYSPLARDSRYEEVRNALKSVFNPSLPAQIRADTRSFLTPEDFKLAEAVSDLNSPQRALREAAVRNLDSSHARNSPHEIIRKASRFMASLDDRVGAGLDAETLSKIRADATYFYATKEYATVRGSPDFSELLHSPDPKTKEFGNVASMADQALEDPALVARLLHEVKLEAAKRALERGALQPGGRFVVSDEELIALLAEKGRALGVPGYHSVPETMLGPHEWAEKVLRRGLPFVDRYWEGKDHETLTHWIQLLALARFKGKDFEPIGGISGFMQAMADDMVRVESPSEEKGRSVWFRSFDRPKRQSMNSPDFFGPALRGFFR
jgi:hypothetical protein